MANEETRAQILAAAGPVFAENGFHGATIREICEVADVNLAAVNYHFRNKRGLYVAAVRSAHEFGTTKAPYPTWSADAPPTVRLNGCILALIKRWAGVDESSWPLRLLLREHLTMTESCDDLAEIVFQPPPNDLLAILDDLVPADTSESKRLWLGYSIISQCMFSRIALTILADERDQMSSSPEQLAEHITEFSLGAIDRLGRVSKASAQERTFAR